MTCPTRPCESETSTSVDLPNELVEKILTDGWRAHMSPEERLIYTTTIILVCESWLATLTKIATKDVYLPTSASILQHELAQGYMTTTRQEKRPPRSNCRSLTRQICLIGENVLQETYMRPRERRRGIGIQDIFATFHALPFLQNLQTVAVEYYTHTLEGVKANLWTSKIFNFSYQATVLRMDLEYTFPVDSPSWVIDAMCPIHRTRETHSKQPHVPWALPHLERVSTTTTTDSPLQAQDKQDELTAKILRLCPHLEYIDCEELCQVKVTILSSSRSIPGSCAVVHGGLHRRQRVLSTKDGSIVVRSEAMGLVLELAGSEKSRSESLEGIPRTLRIFGQRACGW